jgi:Uri superfamily endonuclease
MQARPGTYALVFNSSSDQQVEVGKLGRIQIRPGYYVYVGSAFGPGGLKARIAHHRKISEKPHWHMDYLRPALVLKEVWFTYDSRHREHQWAGVLARIGDATVPIPGFGASDCRCESHLYLIRPKPSVRRFRVTLHANLNRHGRLFAHYEE